jgi:hypothetical protein
LFFQKKKMTPNNLSNKRNSLQKLKRFRKIKNQDSSGCFHINHTDLNGWPLQVSLSGLTRFTQNQSFWSSSKGWELISCIELHVNHIARGHGGIPIDIPLHMRKKVTHKRKNNVIMKQNKEKQCATKMQPCFSFENFNFIRLSLGISFILDSQKSFALLMIVAQETDKRKDPACPQLSCLRTCCIAEIFHHYRLCFV